MSRLSPAKQLLLDRMKRGALKKDQNAPLAAGSRIARRRAESPIPLSFSQQRIWLIQQMERSSTAYNISGAVRLLGELDCGALEKSLNEISKRHESLRTTFKLIGQEPAQVISQPEPWRLEVIELGH